MGWQWALIWAFAACLAIIVFAFWVEFAAKHPRHKHNRRVKDRAWIDQRDSLTRFHNENGTRHVRAQRGK
jgi:hypothetical protein